MFEIYNNRIYTDAVRKIADSMPEEKLSFLVTGGTGLIGSCIVDVLIEASKTRDYKIYVLDISSERMKSRFSGYEKSLVFIEQNICDQLDPSNHYDYIIHTASMADPKSYALYPVETILINVMGARNVLEYCRNRNTRVLLTSTFEVYGKLDKDVYTEDDFGLIDYNQLRACYPESKRTAELLFRTYNSEFNVDCVIARLASIYGPTMQKKDSKAHAQFISNAVRGESIVLKSEGLQRRTYCYLMDAVSGLLTVLLNGTSGEAYNIANCDSIASIAEVAQCVAEISGTKVVYDQPSEIEQKGFSKPQNCILKSKKIESLGWKGLYNLKQGLYDSIEILKSLDK